MSSPSNSTAGLPPPGPPPAGKPRPPHSVISLARDWSAAEFETVCVIFGFTLGFGYFVVCHAARQARRLSAFTVLVWVAVSSNLIAACATFLFATGVLNESTPYYLFTLHLWAVQLHCVFQIMVSRIVLIWASPSHRQFLRWGIFVWTSVLITAAFSTWIPARLQVSKTFIKLNNIFYPTIRILCLLTNLFLSVTFIQSVKKTLVANGLEKYNKLLKFNAKIMGLSLLLDTVPIFLLVCQSSLVYISFFPLSTMVKLEMELVTNDLIVEVVRSEQELIRVMESPGVILGLGYPNFYAKDGTIAHKPHNNEQETRQISNHVMWKLPSLLDLSIASEPVAIPPTGVFLHGDELSQFGIMCRTFSPVDSGLDRWPHSRISSAGHTYS
ncbi:hypothetical protein PCASD_12931 [Puccinia coronata f. sp. avenae]|uniref:Uncharacterized protein n=2 Tax=Puccinia coronata f. sp. avenae TaxID=200324 RepID=A0A2N5U9Y5_9BASI|nr:hypothetical protein PCASD_12931 [Puccinia coronata f. sp. avenae]